MAEDDIVKQLLWQNDQTVRSGGGGGGGEENALLSHQQRFHQNLFIQEDEMSSWLHHQNLSSVLSFSNAASTLATQPPNSLPLRLPLLASPYAPSAEGPTATAARCPANFSWLRGNTVTGGRVEARPLIPAVINSKEVGSSATCSSSSAAESCLTPATHGAVIGRVSPTFVVPGLTLKEKPVTIENVSETAGTPSSRVLKPETELIQTQPPTEKETADDKKRKEREDTIEEIQETRASCGSTTAKKRTQASETHNLSEKRRREKINERMKALQELIPRCNKTDKASMLDDAIEYLKSLQMQLQMISRGGGAVPMMYPANMQQQFMPHVAMGMMGMSQPPFIPFPGVSFPSQAHMAGLGPPYPVPRYPIPNIQASDPSRVHLLSPQPNPSLNQSQFPAYMNPYSQFVGLHQMQQPPPSQNQTTMQLSFSQASSSKEPEDQAKQPKG